MYRALSSFSDASPAVFLTCAGRDSEEVYKWTLFSIQISIYKKVFQMKFTLNDTKGLNFNMVSTF